MTKLPSSADPQPGVPGSCTLRCGACVAVRALAVVAGDEHVDGRHDEEGEEGADEHPADQDQTDGIRGGGAGDQSERKMTLPVAGDSGALTIRINAIVS